ncbi:hypothetical protein CAAN3_17S00430 [[Candida] anglica]
MSNEQHTIASPVPRKSQVAKKTDSEKLLPSLSVKADPNLKSCLSTANLSRGSPQVPSTTTNAPNSNAHQPEHAAFLVQEDFISPIKHGILGDDLTLANTTTLPNRDSPVSILSSAPNSPPFISHGTNLDSTLKSPNGGLLHNVSSPPLSRVSSLRYVNNNNSDKKLIEVTRHRTASPTSSSYTSPQPDEEAGHHFQSDVPIDGFSPPTTVNEKKHLLIAITGCISVHKNILLIIEKLFEFYTHDKLEIQVILTKSAQWFLSEKLHKFEALGVKVWFHDDGWKYFTNKELPLSIKSTKLTPNLLSKYSLAFELQKWTDVLLIAPLSANTMAKMINGLSDNLLTDMLHVWPLPLPPNAANNGNNSSTSGVGNDNTVLTNNLLSPKSIIAALALTNSMYSHPITRRQLAALQETYPNMSILKPVEKCVDVDGNIAMGGMRSWREVVHFVVQKLGEPEVEDDDEDDEDDEEEEEEEEDEEQEELEELEHGERSVEDGTVDEGRGEAGGKDKKSVQRHPDGSDHRIHRSGTVSNKELAEHNKIATINALLNSGIGHLPKE